MSWHSERADASSAGAANAAMVKAMKEIRWNFVIGMGPCAVLFSSL
jgi:hypothetical protein